MYGKKSVTKNETRLQEKLRDKLCEIQQVYGFEGEFSKDKKIEVSVIARILENLYERKVIESVEFVYGKGKRKTPLQRDIESLEEMCERQLKYDDYTEILGDRNSFSKTDREATFMRLKEDHMRNGQLKPAYNVQIGVEGEYVVGVDISDKPTDQLTLWPLLERAKNYLVKSTKTSLRMQAMKVKRTIQNLKKMSKLPTSNRVLMNSRKKETLRIKSAGKKI